MATRLTDLARGAGCGCKLGKDVLAEALRGMPLAPFDPDVLVGHEGFDDAAVYRLREDLCVVASVDFFTPVVDDPETFGRIAATNAMSDLFAMGARPTLALAVAAFPKEEDPATLAAILRGGADAAQAVGCPVLGGHTIDDPEPKYGLAVIGTAHPERLMTNGAGRAGDLLVLTKALGVGIAVNGLRSGVAPAAVGDAAVQSMLTSNGPAAEAALAAGVRCATDVTGFGLVGHLGEMASASGLGAVVHADRVPVIEGVLALAAQGCVPGGGRRNRAFAEGFLEVEEGVEPDLETVLCDPQTSGGLVLAVSPEARDDLLAGLADRGVPGAVIGRLESAAVGRVRVTATAD